MSVLIPFSEADLPFAIVHEYRISTTGRIIYLAVILSIGIGLLCMAFVSMPVTVMTKGAIYGNHFSPCKVTGREPDAGNAKNYESDNNLLLAYCDVSPSDIAMIQTGQEVRFQLEGFDGDTWGAVSGRVVKIPDDLILTASNGPVFRVHCNLNRGHLEWNGRRAFLKEGMKLTAEFHVGTRSLLRSKSYTYTPLLQAVWI